MTGIQDDLAGIRKEAGNVPAHRRDEFLNRADRVEAEVARLTDEQLVKYERGDDFRHDFWKERALAAEAEVARLRADADEVEQLAIDKGIPFALDHIAAVRLAHEVLALVEVARAARDALDAMSSPDAPYSSFPPKDIYDTGMMTKARRELAASLARLDKDTT